MIPKHVNDVIVVIYYFCNNSGEFEQWFGMKRVNQVFLLVSFEHDYAW